MDARHATGVQVGEGNFQINYNYGKLTFTDGAAPPPLVSVSGFVDSPYRGLSAFEERDAAFFFGRESAATQVLERMSRCLNETGLLVVSGVSGAGKSSLLQAGVLPRIRGTGLGTAPGAASWPCLVFTPTREPLDQLAVQVAPLAGVVASAIRPGLDAHPDGFALTVRQAALAQPGGSGGQPARRLLLVIDQFEQVFTQCPDEEQRQAFITAVTAAARRSGPDQTPGALVVLGVRADFEARCADYPQLTDAIQSRYLVTSMTERQLRLAISEPARLTGSSVEDDLVDVLLREVRTRQPASSPSVPRHGPASGAGVLPLLSHALDQAWRNRTGDVLALADYERTGGIEGAVADSAQRAYDHLTPAQQAAARQVFIQLTATTSDGVDTANRADRAELIESKSAAEALDVAAVLEAFAAERLLVLDADTVEISHEVLLTAWPLLRDTWLAETHSDRIVRTRLHNSAADWARDSRDSSYLYSGSLLDAAAATAARIGADPARYPPLSQSERDFLRASQSAHRRRVRRRQGIIAVLMALVVGFAAVAVIAVRNGQTAVSELDAAVSAKLVAESQALGDNNPVLAKLETVAAWRINPSDQARHAMLAAARLPGGVILASGTVPVDAVAYRPDGKILATGIGNGDVRLWDMGTRQPISILRSGHSGQVGALAFSTDGKVLAAGGKYGSVQLWDVATRQEVGAPLTGSTQSVSAVAFSPNGKLLAVGRYAGTVQLWDVATHQQIATLQAGDTYGSPAVAFSPDGKTLATASIGGAGTGTVRLWDVATHQQLGAPLPGDTSTVYSVAFSPDGKTLAVGNYTGSVQLWNATTRQQIGTPLVGAADAVYSVAFSPDGRTLAAASYAGTVQLWDVATRQQIGVPLTGDGRPVVSVAFSPDGKTLAAGSWDDTVRLWNVAEATDDPIGSLTPGTWGAQSVAFAPDGKTLATGSWTDAARLWNTATHQQIGGPLAHGTNFLADWVSSVAFSPDGKILATGDWDDTARLWDVATHQQIGTPLNDDANLVESVAFSPDGKILATGEFNGTTRLWNVATHQEIGVPLNGRAGMVESLAFSPDGKILAIGDFDYSVQLWNVATRQRIGTLLPPDASAIYSVAFSPDGRTLATGGGDGTARLWDVATRQETGSALSGDTNEVSSVAFSPDGKTLATGSFDHTVRLWDLATGQLIGAPLTEGNSAAIESVAFSPDGNTLASAEGYGGTVQLWNVSYLTHTVPFLCASAGRTLTRTEWEQAAPGLGYQNICP